MTRKWSILQPWITKRLDGRKCDVGKIWEYTPESPKWEWESSRSIENITPLMALEYLASSWGKGDRNLAPTSVEKIEDYASMMKDSLWWNYDEDPIVIKLGMVADGRHRLHAILLSGKTLRCEVVKMTKKEQK